MRALDLHYLRANTVLGKRYEIKGIIGEGGFGITYLGWDKLYKKDVAIKEFFPQGIVTRNHKYGNDVTVTYARQEDVYNAGMQRFLSEASVMSKFGENQGIVSIIDFFQENNTVYIVMEYLDGVTLKEFLAGNGRIELEEMLEMLAPLLESLDAVHREGLIHRDISPDNIMVLKNGEIKLMDFGAARDYTGFGEKSLSIILKPGYAPPEQYQSHGVQGPWTDIYALCATIYKCLTGQTPEDSIERVINDNLKKPSGLGIDIPPNMEKALLKGMSVAPGERYQNLKDFCDDFYSDFDEADFAEAERDPEEAATVIAENDTAQGDIARNGMEPADPVQSDLGQDAAGKETDAEKEAAGKSASLKQSGKKAGRGKIIAAAAVLCILLAGGGGYHFYQKSLEREVPNVVNTSYEKAALQAAGDDNSLILVKAGEEYSDTVKKGEIISQKVEAGTVLKKGDKVQVIVSKGALVTVPDLSGEKKAKAKKLLADNKLKFKLKKKKWSDKVKKGCVISQSIKAGKKKEEGTTVSVVLSKGIEQVKVPDVTDKTRTEAEKLLKKAKLKMNTTSDYSSSVSEGNIISQSLNAGKTVDKNTTVSLVISLGEESAPEPAYTPSYSGGSSSGSSGGSGRKSSGGSKKKSSGSSKKKSSGSSKKKSSGGGESLRDWDRMN